MHFDQIWQGSCIRKFSDLCRKRRVLYRKVFLVAKPRSSNYRIQCSLYRTVKLFHLSQNLISSQNFRYHWPQCQRHEHWVCERVGAGDGVHQEALKELQTHNIDENWIRFCRDKIIPKTWFIDSWEVCLALVRLE